MQMAHESLPSTQRKPSPYGVRLDQLVGPAWYVIHTLSRHEAKVETGLSRKGFETFLPRVTVRSRRKDRKRFLDVPLFPGYLFVHTEIWPRNFYEIIKMPGVVRFLGVKGRITCVSSEIIESIQTMITSGRSYCPWDNLTPGMRVRVAEGPLEGVIGVILRTRAKKRRLVISVELMNVAVAVELADDAVEPYS